MTPAHYAVQDEWDGIEMLTILNKFRLLANVVRTTPTRPPEDYAASRNKTFLPTFTKIGISRMSHKHGLPFAELPCFLICRRMRPGDSARAILHFSALVAALSSADSSCRFRRLKSLPLYLFKLRPSFEFRPILPRYRQESL